MLAGREAGKGYRFPTSPENAMHNEPGRGPTRNDKTLERAKQERASPGATTAGSPEEGAPPQPKSPTDPTLSVTGGDLTSSNNHASRRGDAAAEGQT